MTGERNNNVSWTKWVIAGVAVIQFSLLGLIYAELSVRMDQTDVATLVFQTASTLDRRQISEALVAQVTKQNEQFDRIMAELTRLSRAIERRSR